MPITQAGAPGGSAWSPWYRSESAYITTGPVPVTLDTGHMNDIDPFLGPYIIQVVYASEDGLVMREEVFANGGEVNITIAEDTAAYIYFRVKSATPIPTGIDVATDGPGFEAIPASEMPPYEPENPTYTPPLPVPLEQLPQWVDDVLGSLGLAKEQSSPLVIDLDGDGIELTEFDSSTTTWFDIDGDGFAEQTAWVDADDGLLARDVNDNGVIDDVSELFGSSTVDGFAKLAQLDSNVDLIIDQHDATWSELVVWQDANGDAVSQAEELISLATAGISGIRLDTVQASTATIEGNTVSHTGTFMKTAGGTGTISDIWFTHDDVRTHYAADEIDLNLDTLQLPSLRGFGTIADLHIAMSLDENLLDLVDAFKAGWSNGRFADEAALDADIEEILFTWAGVDQISPTSRGIYLDDARKLEFLERLIADKFVQYGFQPDPEGNATKVIMTAWDRAYTTMKAALLLQAGLDLFGDSVAYDLAAGEITGTPALEEAAVAALTADAPAPGTANEAYWMAVARIIDSIVGLDNLTNTEEGWLDDAVLASDLTLSWADVLDLMDDSEPYAPYTGTNGADSITASDGDNDIYAYDGNDTVHALRGDDTVYAGAGDDVVYGGDGDDELFGGIGNESGSGNDTLYGGDGDDTLWGEDGDDILAGGEGGNVLRGRTGDDTYVYGGGTDWIDDQGGTDQILMPVGITAEDLTLRRLVTSGSNVWDLLISVEGAGSIEIGEHFRGSAYKVEQIVFSDTTTLDLTDLSGIAVYLDDGANTLTATLDTANPDDIVHGMKGDDYIRTFSGDDILDGGEGNDELMGDGGNDTYIASPGFDKISEGGYGGTDTIWIPAGYSLADVSLFCLPGSGYTWQDLSITIAGLGQIVVLGHFLSSGYQVENLYFAGTDATVSLSGLAVETRGSAYADSMSGITSGASTNDIFNGFEGNDSMSGGAGDDTYVFSAGHDTVWETGGTDTLLVRPGFDTGDITIARVKGSGSDWDGLQLKDNQGNTITVYSHFSEWNGSTADMVEYVVFADTTLWDVLNMEIEAYGTAGADTIAGMEYGDASNADVIYGWGGNDNIGGLGGDDQIHGGDGNDYLQGGDGADTLHGDDGDDTLYAGVGNDTLYGGAGNDQLRGEDGDDVLRGGDGDDTIYGDGFSYQYGDDVLYGGLGADTLIGGNGADRLVFEAASAFSAVDTIIGFNKTAGDAIDIADVLEGYDPLTDLITDFVQITTSGSDSLLSVDRDGTGSTYGFAQIATIAGVTGLTDEAALVNSNNLIVV